MPDSISWNVRPGHPAAQDASYKLISDTSRSLELRYQPTAADLLLDGQPLAHLEGTARLVTGKRGELKSLLGIDPKPQKVTLTLPARHSRTFTLAPNQQILL